ncbi:hypothetical protein [Stieleria marina]|uniref:Uncharacterized protein n=1 Tax=Stieleria marina TaxID=1930275 RepID=A0A517P3B3_9BACT|nr:hypothetical protein K239x_58770 [Planctomycetes bacterium K23_9]
MDAPRLNLFSQNIEPAQHDGVRRESVQPIAERRERELDRIAGLSKPKTMKIPLKVMVPLLMRAAKHNHTWLEDFADDTAEIDADLHQLLMAFQDLPHTRAA